MIQKQTRSKKQLTTLIVCAVLFAILLPVYFIFVQPLLDEVLSEKEPPELMEGEILGANNRILMFEHVEKADILSIEVHNEHGSYTFYRSDDDTFYIKGMEGAPYSLELLSSLVVSSGYTLSMKRLDDLNDDLSVYGFGEDDNPAWYILTKMDGTTHKVLIGDMIPTGGGYYCMYEGRRAVYVLDTSLSATLLADIHSLITPSLSLPVSTATYTKVDDFTIIKNGELLVAIDMMTAEETGAEDGLMDYVFKYPKKYSPNLSTYSAIMEMMGSFAGLETVACGSDLEKLDETMMKETYGIDIENPYFMLSYSVEDVDCIIVFSKPDEDGMMYAYSTVYNLVAKIDVATANFINWGLLQYVDPPLFAENINNIAKIEIKGNIENGDEKLDVDAYFTLEGEGETIVIKQNGGAKPYDADGVKNFRQLYKVMLGIRLQDYSEVKDIEAMTPLAEMIITDDKGETTEYKFYIYSTRRCFYTINGVGEFYVLRDNVEKLLRDTDRMVNGLPIDSDAKT